MDPRGHDAVLDTCVLFPLALRGVLLNAAAQGAFRPAWSERIIGELTANLGPKAGVTPAARKQLATNLRTRFPGAIAPAAVVSRLEPSMPNDPKDRHVLAAAVAVRAPVVVTSNLKDFRAADLRPLGVEAVHPDAFLTRLVTQEPVAVRTALSEQVEYMARRQGRWTEGQLLGHLGGLGASHAMAPRFAARAEQILGIRATPPPPGRDRSPPSHGLTASRSAPSVGLARRSPARDARSI